MLYPILTTNDGTEITASKPDINGVIFVYLEKFDVEKDMFVHATITIPNVSIYSYAGYTEKEIKELLQYIHKIEKEIIGKCSK